LDVALEDAELLAEVEMTTNLMIAGSESVSALTQQEVDALLEVGIRIPAQPSRTHVGQVRASA
jgi:hypothetical protein